MLTVPPNLGGPGGRSERLTVYVKDSGGTYRDLSTPGVWVPTSLVDSVSFEEDIDDPHRTCTIVLKRELDGISAAPLMTASPLNRGWDPANAYAVLLKAGREVRITCAIGPADAPASLFTASFPPGTLASATSVEIFHGRIDRVQAASGAQVELTCRDMGGVLADTWIEEERVYALADIGGAPAVPVALRIWAPSTLYAVNEYVIPTEAKRSISGSPRFYKCTTGGTSAATEPTWPTSSTVTSGGAVFTYQGTTNPDVGYPVETIMQQIISAWVPGVTLVTPVSPAWSITQFLQQRQPVLEAVRALAMQLGWDLRFKWSSGSGAFVLTFYEPARSKTTPDATFAPSDYTEISRLEQDITGVRNAWKGVFPDSTNKDPEGNPLRGEVLVTDATSITDYGRLFAEIGEDQLSAINTAAKMTQMLNAALSDTKDPKVEAETTLVHGWPFVEVGDLYRFSANNRHFDTDQDLAVTHHATTFAGGVMKTTLSCRGKPSGGYELWHGVSGRSVPASIHQVRVFEANGGANLSTKDVVGGTRLIIGAPPEGRALGAEYEYHVSAVSGFTPDSTTLKAASKATSLELADLIPGKQYYAKVVPRARNATKLARAFPSEQIAFLAGQANAAHLSSSYDPNQFPLNGDFETQMDPAAPPDHWIDTSDAGVWGAGHGLYVVSGSGALSGSNYLKFDLNYSTTKTWTLYTDFFPVLSSAWYQVKAWVQRFSGTTGDIQIWIYQYDNTFANVGTTKIYDITTATPVAWTETSYRKQMASTAKYARIVLISAAGTFDLVAGIDRVSLTRDLVGANFIDYAPGTSDTTTSATFATLTGAQVTLSQQSLGGYYHLALAVSMYSTVANSEVEFAILVDGTQIYLFRFFFNLANCHTCISASYVYLAPLVAGAHTIDVQWRRMSGTGTLTIASNDWIKGSVIHVGGSA